jgi:hypothetical protein
MRRQLLLGALAAGFGPWHGTAAPAAADEFNARAGIPLFGGSGTLWEEEADAVAARLGLPRESVTSTDASYRLYPREDTRIFGRRAYSVAMSAREGKPVAVTFIFANKGDSLGQFVPASAGRLPPKLPASALRGYKKAISEDEEALAALFTSVAGEPRQEKTSQGAKMQEKALRWDWNGHAILLASVRDEYAAVRILPPAELEESGERARVSDRELKQALLERVEKRPNGDVVLRDLPMVDQGPKGFCVPATMERMLRYLGIPADMYLLAMAANTQPGGGTMIRDVLWAVADPVRRAGRKILPLSGSPDLARVSKYIESGLPVLWAITTSGPIDARINEHTAARAGVTDWSLWADSLKPARLNARKLARGGDSGHVCLIIGFNRETGELALSDSWGPGAAERWITAEEAAAISQGAMAVVSW